MWPSITLSWLKRLEKLRDADNTAEVEDVAPAPAALGTGIDVSSHQGSIDWDAVARALGHRGFVFVKVTEGVGFVDKRFRENVRGAADAGLFVGAYHFARIDSGSDAHRDACDEMEAFYAATEPVRQHLVMPEGVPTHAVDVELGGIKGRPAGHCRVWCLAALSYTYVTPILYTGYWTWRHMKRPTPLLFGSPMLWQADYGRKGPKQMGDWKPAIWQYTGKGRIDGVVGHVDRNRWMTEAPNA